MVSNGHYAVRRVYVQISKQSREICKGHRLPYINRSANFANIGGLPVLKHFLPQYLRMCFNVGSFSYSGFVAVKKLYAANPGPAERKALENEIRLLKSLHHSNVLTLLGVVTKPHLAIVMDWCHSSLFHRLHVAESGYDPINALRLAMRVADGMSYLHSRGVLHRCSG